MLLSQSPRFRQTNLDQRIHLESSGETPLKSRFCFDHFEHCFGNAPKTSCPPIDDLLTDIPIMSALESTIKSVTPTRHASLMSVDSTSTSEISLDPSGNSDGSGKAPRSPNGEEEDALDEGEILVCSRHLTKFSYASPKPSNT